MPNQQKNIDVLLCKNIRKSYSRVENIASSVMKLIEDDCWNDDFNIGEPFYKSLDWYDIYSMISDSFSHISPFDVKVDIDSKHPVTWYPKSDYLHYHNICDAKLRNKKADMDSIENYIDIHEGIYRTCVSVVDNIDEKPYWI